MLCLLLWPASARAQGVQNMDIYWLFGSQHVKSQTVAGTNVTIPGGSGLTVDVGYGYQVVRKSAASLWIEAFWMFGGGVSGLAPGISGTFSSGWSALVLPGLRFMVPVQSRISVYAAGGFGLGDVAEPQIRQQPFPTASSTATYFGMFDGGGGVDIRLNRLLSVRGEVRDYVTHERPGGLTGRNHAVASAGFAIHF